MEGQASKLEVKNMICAYGAAAVLDAEFFVVDKVIETSVFVLLDAAERVHDTVLGLHLKVERARAAAATRKVDATDLLKTDMHRRLVHVDEAALQRVQVTRGRLVRTADSRSP